MTTEQLVQPKKSVWDVIDNLLPSAAAVYGQIRQKKTGVNPFETTRPVPDKEELQPKIDTEGFANDFTPSKVKTLPLLIGGIALIGLGVGTYFFIKKYKKQ
jgi:hypothetical protein